MSNGSLLQAGDIMIKYNDGSLVNHVINIGQWLGKGDSQFTHAGIASSPTRIIEMDGDGLQEHDLTTTNAKIRYRVYRCIMPEVGAGAAAAAEMMQMGFAARHMPIEYSKSGAVKSIFSSSKQGQTDLANDVLDRLLGTVGESFFCSGHVVVCYQMACSQGMAQSNFPVQHANAIFSLEAHCYQPAYLEKVLKESQQFARVGEYRGATRIGA